MARTSSWRVGVQNVSRWGPNLSHTYSWPLARAEELTVDFLSAVRHRLWIFPLLQ